MDDVKNRIVVVGAGLTGMVAANELKRQIELENLPYEVVVLEEKNHIGGHHETIELDNHYFDICPSFVMTKNEQFYDFIEKYKLDDLVEEVLVKAPDLYLYNTFYKIDYPNVFGIPLYAKDIFKLKMLRKGEKFDAYFKMIFSKKDYEFLPATYKDLLYEKYGTILVDYILMSQIRQCGIHDIKRCTSTQIKEVIDECGSRSFPMTKKRFDDKLTINRYVRFSKGIASIINNLYRNVQEQVFLGQTVKNIEEHDHIIALSLQKGRNIAAGGVILAVSPENHPNLFTHQQTTPIIKNVNFVSMGSVIFKFKKADVHRMPHSYGFVIPQKSEYFITRVMLLNELNSDLKDAEYIYLNVQFGRQGEDRFTQLNKKVMYEFIYDEIKTIMDIQGEPLAHEIRIWKSEIPYDCESFHMNMQGFEQELLDNMENVLIKGLAYYGGEVINDIQEGDRLAKQMLYNLKKRDGLLTGKEVLDFPEYGYICRYMS